MSIEKQFQYWIIPSLLNDSQLKEIQQQFPSTTHMIHDHTSSRSRYYKPCKITNSIQSIFQTVKQTLCQQLEIDPSSYRLFHFEFRSHHIGDFMDWHRDYEETGTNTIQKDPTFYFEGVFVVENTSDSKTEFQVEKEDQSIEIVSVHTKPNDCILLCKNGIKHRVTTLTTGYRNTIKFRLHPN